MPGGIYGARQIFAGTQRDESQMKRNLKGSGLFPELGKNHTDWMNDKIEKARKGQEASQVRTWRMAQEDRVTAQLDQEKAVSELRTGRRATLIGESGRARASQRAAEQVFYAS